MKKTTLLAVLMSAGVATAQDAALVKKLAPYKERGPEWLTSRLQMHWNTHATDTYVQGEFLSSVGGECAPAPTVKMSGSRTHITAFIRPKLDELPPYADDPRGMWLASKQDSAYQWVPLRQTGNMIQSLNQEVMGLANNAATLWAQTGDTAYAELAAQPFDTYMTGIYYRNTPQDIDHGHIQTLMGFASFEVIHENIINSLTSLYTTLKPYLAQTRPDKIEIYESAFRKWADLIIANGVPHNNWNSIQASFILKIALALGGEDQLRYVDQVMNRDSVRQWSLGRLADYGFDSATGMWAESAGYSQVVLNDYTEFVTTCDEQLGIDLVSRIPVIRTAMVNAPQYLFPDRMVIGFGDTHPAVLSPKTYDRMVANARLHGRTDDAAMFADMKARLADPAADISDMVSPTFHAPNASWLVLRNGMHRRHSLMAALNASQGNHMHANGISMELYGKGLRLAPDAGIGYQLYTGDDYREWYSQFPAHNTVCVDGVSAYPIMKSSHPFTMLDCYPAPGGHDYGPLAWCRLAFVEPETMADQERVTAIVNTSDTTGYYVDIFRSRKQQGGDKTHDYFYHNMGQVMTLTAADGTALPLEPTEELAFADAHLMAYSYIYNKRAALSAQDVRATFTVQMPDTDDITMTMWMRGEQDRRVFSALSPSTEGLSRLKDMPYDIRSTPTLTFVARQYGEAWDRPFVAVYEPSSRIEPGLIRSVEFPRGKAGEVVINVHLTDGRTHTIRQRGGRLTLK